MSVSQDVVQSVVTAFIHSLSTVYLFYIMNIFSLFEDFSSCVPHFHAQYMYSLTFDTPKGFHPSKDHAIRVKVNKKYQIRVGENIYFMLFVFSSTVL